MTQELSTTSILSLFETTKTERESFAMGVVNSLHSGVADSLQIHLQVKCMEDIIKLLNSNNNYKTALLDAAQRQGEKSFTFHNAKFEIKEVGAKYDFSQCSDPVLEKLHNQQKEINEAVKARETMLKTVSGKGLELVTEDGEVITVYPPSKSSTTSVAVTLK